MRDHVIIILLLLCTMRSVAFQFGNPAVRTYCGVLRVLSGNAEVRAPAAVAQQNAYEALASTISLPSELVRRDDSGDDDCASRVVVLLDVPLRIALSELRTIVAAHEQCITHMLVVRPRADDVLRPHNCDSSRPQDDENDTVDEHELAVDAQTYGVLVRLTDGEAARVFRLDLNGARFNSIEPESVRALRVRSVEFADAAGAAAAYFPVPVLSSSSSTSSSSPSLPPAMSAAALSCTTSVDSTCDAAACPVCLERVDDEAQGGSIVSLCAHRFHVDCLCRWADSSCPVCRFNVAQEEGAACEVCNRRDDLWLCLICGHVGCGRAAGAHSEAHFHTTAHAYAAEVRGGARRVWDYARDGFVHRLLASEDAAKSPMDADDIVDATDASHDALATAPPSSASLAAAPALVQSAAAPTLHAAPDARERHRRLLARRTSVKLEHIVCEYNHLLGDQMARQRTRVSERLARLERARAPELAAGAATLAALRAETEAAERRLAAATEVRSCVLFSLLLALRSKNIIRCNSVSALFRH